MADAATAKPQLDLGSGSDPEEFYAAVTLFSVAI